VVHLKSLYIPTKLNDVTLYMTVTFVAIDAIYPSDEMSHRKCLMTSRFELQKVR